MAANPFRGESELVVDGDRFKLVLDVNAFCLIQPVLNLRPLELVAAFQAEADDMVVHRALLWGALQRNHECHLVQAGEIMADAGIPLTRKALADCLAACFGTETSGDRKAPRPPRKAKKTPGTG